MDLARLDAAHTNGLFGPEAADVLVRGSRPSLVVRRQVPTTVDEPIPCLQCQRRVCD